MKLIKLIAHAGPPYRQTTIGSLPRQGEMKVAVRKWPPGVAQNKKKSLARRAVTRHSQQTAPGAVRALSWVRSKLKRVRRLPSLVSVKYILNRKRKYAILEPMARRQRKRHNPRAMVVENKMATPGQLRDRESMTLTSPARSRRG